MLIVFALICLFWIVLFAVIGLSYFFDRPAERSYGLDIVHDRDVSCGSSEVGMGRSLKPVNCKKCLDEKID